MLICAHDKSSLFFPMGAPTFDAGEAFAMMTASFVAEVCIVLLQIDRINHNTIIDLVL